MLLVGFVLSDLSVDSWGILLDSGEFDSLVLLGHWENVTGLSGGGLLELLGSGVVDLTLLVDTFSSWEKNKLALVFLKSCNILLVLLHVCGLSSMINCNSDGLSESSGESCGLQFLVSKASSVSYLGTVLFGTSVNKRSELLERSWERTSSL